MDPFTNVCPHSSQIAAKVSAPLTRVDEILILSGENSKITGELNRLLAEIPASVQTLTGVDLTKVSVLGDLYACCTPNKQNITKVVFYANICMVNGKCIGSITS